MALPFKSRLLLAGRRLAAAVPEDQIHRRVSEEPDTVRAIGALAVGLAATQDSSQLELLRPFADDSHFGVREWAWIGLREQRGSDLLAMLPDLEVWAHSDSANCRRFVSEILRPRGVWCRYLEPVRANPEIAFPAIELMRADPHKYVQLSVGNWLNDVGKDHPKWVESICRAWTADSDERSTYEICKRGLRNLNPRILRRRP